MEIKTIDDYIMREMVMGLSKEDMGLAAQCKTPQEYVVRKLVKAEERIDHLEDKLMDVGEDSAANFGKAEILQRREERLFDLLVNHLGFNIATIERGLSGFISWGSIVEDFMERNGLKKIDFSDIYRTIKTIKDIDEEEN